MKTIYKYTLNPGEANRFRTKRLLQVCHVAPVIDEEVRREMVQHGHPSREANIRAERINVWCLVDPSAEQISDFVIFGTGHPIEGDIVFCGTAVMASGLVWHLFVPDKDFYVGSR
ncbi:hypothetical protein HWB99_gp069 [Mycobacterium phage DrLupo]|uniref:DUF7352 domain-containing protein n=1 Tax=Mycobacterium phage DrLupo TaxID=2499037 RepID=A0A3S9UQP0_9CAUD|nr:hypothetical protein HWB99_gp069 [Mycobacterium phage DrLupo]AZS12605.1 hypothetical protein SEA_DRLUPO_69 [Mycobacterium phage DrLupo]